MSQGLRSIVRAWGKGARGAGFFVLLVAGSAAAGAVIALPLWLFATSARGLYTACVLCLAAAGILYAVVRAILRARRAPRDPALPRRSPLSGLLVVLQTLLFLAGLYLCVVLVAHGIWLLAIPVLLVWLVLVALLGLARRAAKAWRPGRNLPKIRKE